MSNRSLLVASFALVCSLFATAEFASSQTADDETVYKREAIAGKDGKVIERDNFKGVTVTSASASFWRTCSPTKYYAVRGGAIIEAFSDSCRRRNGSWGGSTLWRGTCRSDLANCNGKLECGRC